jgi:CHAT domain-containing protein
MARIQVNSRDWSIQRTPVSRAGGRRSASAASSFPAEFLTSESAVAEEFTAEPTAVARRGGAAPSALDFSYDIADGEAAVLAIRHPSGALTFHLPVESTRRGPGKPGKVRFAVTVHSTDPETGRRSILSKAVKAIVIKVGKVVVDKAVSFVLPKLAAAFEKRVWSKRGLEEGWLKVTRETLTKGPLVSEIPSSTDRALLFIHGTFSNAASAYGALGSTNFFDRVAQLYGDRIFAFNHFTISRTPEENARMLLDGLPEKVFTFDVVTHSRGGLVLRNLVERATAFGPLAGRFTLGRAVLVASPNQGTPLATPARWQDTVGWIANLLELFPENPFTTGAEFVANALVWLARHASGDLPGLHSMDGEGDLISDLQAPPGPPPDAYSALVANYNPTGNVLQRMLDTGVDQFFGSANDLVVPSEGGWRVDDSGATFIPGSRIGCYGPGGNLGLDSVTHVSFFSHQETADFLVTALSGQAQQLPPVDPAKALPDRRLMRSTASGAFSAVAVQSRSGGPSVAPIPAPPTHAVVERAAVVASDTFHLVVLPRSESEKRHSQILAHYGSARVLEDFYLSGTDTNAGKRWQTIISNHERIKSYVNDSKGQMPSEKELREFGKVLFETLFPGAVRRLYDTARSLQRSERLNVILTSTIPWVADKPWEFSYDPVRKTALATEELHFIRNVVTAVPAEVIDDRQRLRILVASSVPVGLGKLSIQEEEAVIRRGFEPLREAGLAEIEVLARATPASLHGYICTGNFSVVHFIGHGEYDVAEDKGFLVFQDDQGNPYRVDDRSVREILCGRGIRLVFLNACETGQGGRADFNSGVAPALVAGGIPIVVANQYEVLDTSATFFAQHFYWSLAQGMAVGEAAREARIAVNYSMSGESIDWAVPVVYARDPNSRLCPKRQIDLRTTPSPAVRASSRRSIAQHKVRIAVWDIHSQFPELRSTLDRMNAAQTFYGFEVVDLSVPMDAWHLKENKRYLDADRFADRLAPQISQLGVHYISAIVGEWMVGGTATKNPIYNRYGWWPSKDRPPVLIFSTKGLGLKPKGPATDRAIANVAVSGLAGYLMDRGSHDKPPRDCPSYYNPNRSLALLTARQKFCNECSDKLRRIHSQEFKAMSAILAAFE